MGGGSIDERARRFSDAERRVAELLSAEGREVIAVHAPNASPTRPDALVDGEQTDFVMLQSGATSAAVSMALSRAARHARYAVLDARGSGLSAAAAREGIARFRNRGLHGWRLIGDGFDLSGTV